MVKMVKILNWLEKIGCKNPKKSLEFIKSKKVTKRLSGLNNYKHWEELEKEYNISPNDKDYELLLNFYHIKEFVEKTIMEGDDGVFLASNSCENFNLFLTELEEVENGYDFWEDGELLFEWRYNQEGYLTLK
jgi:hypothetical protein